MTRQRLQATIVLLIGVGLTVVAGWFVDGYARRIREDQVGLQAENATYAVKVALDRVAIAVQAVRALYASDAVTPEQFNRFAGTLTESESIRSLSFYRRVPLENRAQYEQRFDAEPQRTLGIWQYEGPDKPVRAPDRPVFYVVEASYLLSGRPPAIGLDVTSLPGRTGAIERAISEHGLTVSDPTRLLDTSEDGVLLYVPVHDRAGQVIGVAAASVTFSELGLVARHASGVRDISISVMPAVPSQARASADSEVAATAPPAETSPPEADTRSFTFGDRTWLVTAVPSPTTSPFAPWTLLLIVGAGLAATAAILAYLAGLEKAKELTVARGRLRSMLDGLGPLAWLLEADGTIINANRAAIGAFGRARDNGVGKPFWDLSLNGGSADQIDRLRQAVTAAAAGDDVRFDLEVDREGERKVIDLWIRPLASMSGEPSLLVASAVDVTDRYEGEETQRLLMRELDHRMKNTLQVIQAIIRRTARAHSTVPNFEQSLIGRVNAMSRAHELLAQERWLGADIRTVVLQETETFSAGAAITVEGPNLRLNPKAALSVALAMHELGTNASKYGALSQPGGSVSVAWTIERDGKEPRLVLRWKEAGGPPVEQPTERGFGSMLIERSIAYELEGEAVVDYRPDGVVCTISIPLRTIRPFVAPQLEPTQAEIAA